ncbi:pyrophosphatase PpaX [soil metagenome]
MIEAVFFDVDGTLLNTEEYIYQAFEHSLKHHNYEVLSRDVISHVSGKSLEECYREFTSKEEVFTLMEEHKKFQHENVDLVKLFPHTISTLEQIHEKDIRIAAITTRAKKSAIQSLEITGVYHLIDFFVAFEDVTTPKPDPEGIVKALAYFSIQPGEAIMVGDSPVDIEAGRNAKTSTVGVTYGFHGERIRESKPNFVIDDISEVLGIVKK